MRAKTMQPVSVQPGLKRHRVVVLHHRYRQSGGEERYAGQLISMLGQRAQTVEMVERTSSRVGSIAAGRAMLGGGRPEGVAEIVRATGATVVHAHNIYPTFGWRTLAAARQAGAAVVLHLHNYRLYCAIGIAFRDGTDCDQCAPRRMRRGVFHNCRGNPAEAIAYAAGLSRAQAHLIENVDAFVAPSRQLASDLQSNGLDIAFEVLPTWVLDRDFASESHAADGQYALFVGRVAREKGVMEAIEAAKIAMVPLLVAGDGPDMPAAREYARKLAAPVDFLGHIDGQAMVAARMGAAFMVVPSAWREVMPFSALEGLAAGLPLVVTRTGGLPELTEPELSVERGDIAALAEVMARLHGDRALRERAGAASLARARESYSEVVYADRLARIYDLAVERRRTGVSG